MYDTLPVVGSTGTVREAMTVIQRTGRGIALAIDRKAAFVGTVTDGDLRRAVLAGDALDGIVTDFLARRELPPLVAPAGTDTAVLAAMMRERGVRQIPLLDGEGRVADLATLDDPDIGAAGVQAVIMAGGRGSRLRPLTDDCPKPMLPLGGRPLLEITLQRLKDAGIHRVAITTHYLREQIEEHFGNGDGLGVALSYVPEDRPLGTAGALASIESEGPLLVMNGDLVTTIDYRAMLAQHEREDVDMTVAVRRYEQRVPYGVVECRGMRVHSLAEKPVVGYLVNAGIYLLEPVVLSYVPPGERYDMTELIGALLADGHPVGAFAIMDSEYWLDVGTPESYQRAQEEVNY